MLVPEVNLINVKWQACIQYEIEAAVCISGWMIPYRVEKELRTQKLGDNLVLPPSKYTTACCWTSPSFLHIQVFSYFSKK